MCSVCRAVQQIPESLPLETLKDISMLASYAIFRHSICHFTASWSIAEYNRFSITVGTKSVAKKAVLRKFKNLYDLWFEEASLIDS